MLTNASSYPPQIGNLITVSPANPAAGADLDFLVPVNTMIMPMSLSFTYTSAAGGVTRQVVVGANDGSDDIFLSHAHNTQAAATARDYSCIAGLEGAAAAVGGNLQMVPYGANQMLRFGDSIITRIGSIAAGDQISNVVIRYMQWIQE
jgi:hypothetical protein